MNSDGVYTLKQVSIADDTAKTMQKATGIGAAGEIDIDEKHVTLDGFGSYKKVYGNDDSVYINVELEKIVDNNDTEQDAGLDHRRRGVYHHRHLQCVSDR